MTGIYRKLQEHLHALPLGFPPHKIGDGDLASWDPLRARRGRGRTLFDPGAPKCPRDCNMDGAGGSGPFCIPPPDDAQRVFLPGGHGGDFPFVRVSCIAESFEFQLNRLSTAYNKAHNLTDDGFQPNGRAKEVGPVGTGSEAIQFRLRPVSFFLEEGRMR